MFLDTDIKAECFGCEACTQICEKRAISIQEDEEGFRYPVVDASLCIGCSLCRQVCPFDKTTHKHVEDKYAFGGYHKNHETRFDSTSGGAFSAIAEAFCDCNYAIFGAEAQGLLVFHSYITDRKYLGKYRKSKYSQSVIGSSYKDVKQFLNSGKKVLFSGTPCQVAGLLSFLGNTNQDNLLTVEVVCEGVPSPLYIRKLDKRVSEKYGAPIETIDYRYTGKGILSRGKWDFQQMLLEIKGRYDDDLLKTESQTQRSAFTNKTRILVKDRWFNPFWSVWLGHLMSRPSCYCCQFATSARVADITLGDLWGVHLYCPELYGNNVGSSLVVCNTEKGKLVFKEAQENMNGHELRFEYALKYQGPMRKTISENPDRALFMKDLQSEMDYTAINRKWAKRPTMKLLFQKYIWGNRQKVLFWNLKRVLMLRKGKTNA